MNERIKELAEQAGFDVKRLMEPYPGGFPREDMLVLEGFAELIVKECETVLVEKMKEYDSMADRQLSAQAMELARTLILNRFGMV